MVILTESSTKTAFVSVMQNLERPYGYWLHSCE